MADRDLEPLDDTASSIAAFVIGGVLICAMAFAGVTLAIYLLTIP